MVINLRGTSGAGKSTLVKDIIELFRRDGEVTPRIVEGRRRPLYYTMARSGTPRPLMVLGHYETACGGCDTIKTVDQVYELVHRGIGEHYNVLYEGIMVQDDVRRIAELEASGLDTIRVIYLATDIEECLRRVRSRREARGETRPLNEKNTRSRARGLEGTVRRLEAAGVHVERLGCDEALRRCRLMLGV